LHFVQCVRRVSNTRLRSASGWAALFTSRSLNYAQAGGLGIVLLVLYTNSFGDVLFFEEIHIGVRHSITFNQVPTIHMASENEFLNIYNLLTVYLRR
jgi:hypothetical protein